MMILMMRLRRKRAAISKTSQLVKPRTQKDPKIKLLARVSRKFHLEAGEKKPSLMILSVTGKGNRLTTNRVYWSMILIKIRRAHSSSKLMINRARATNDSHQASQNHQKYFRVRNFNSNRLPSNLS